MEHSRGAWHGVSMLCECNINMDHYGIRYAIDDILIVQLAWDYAYFCLVRSVFVRERGCAFVCTLCACFILEVCTYVCFACVLCVCALCVRFVCVLCVCFVCGLCWLCVVAGHVTIQYE